MALYLQVIILCITGTDTVLDGTNTIQYLIGTHTARFKVWLAGSAGEITSNNAYTVCDNNWHHVCFSNSNGRGV